MDSGFMLARRYAKNSEFKIKMGAVICSHKPLGVGWNKLKTHTEYANPHKTDRISIHAEISAVINSGRKYLKNGKIYVYRCYKDGTPAMARPCKDCIKVLKEHGVRTIYYSTDVSPYWVKEKI